MKRLEKYQVFELAHLLELGYKILGGTKGGGFVLLGNGDWRVGWCSYTGEILHLYQVPKTNSKNEP